MEKDQLRQRFRSFREQLSPEMVAAASVDLCWQLADWSELQKAHLVMAYLAFRNELDLTPLFHLTSDIQWILPRIQDQHLVLHLYDPARLVRHSFGMFEPAPDLPIIDPQTLDMVLVPGVAFDHQGGRLGFGGGYYDRLLPTTSALRVGMTYDDCLVEHLPSDAHDQRMDWIVTPTRKILCTER